MLILVHPMLIKKISSFPPLYFICSKYEWVLAVWIGHTPLFNKHLLNGCLEPGVGCIIDSREE